MTTEGINRSPLWTVDGKRLAFSSSKPGPTNLYWKPLAGGEMERLTESENPHGPQSFLPDGSVLSFYEIHTETGRDIWMLPMTGERKPSLFLKTAALEGGAVFSPDGHWIAYVSNDSGRFEIYLKPYPGPGERIQISKEGGAEPMWGKESWELFYRNVAKVMVVKITPGTPIGIGQPQLLFEKKFERSPGSRANFDVTPNGQRLLMVQLVEGK
jgi:Tol biopolymer transport system component